MNVIIRADASAQLGSGHVMRCLALAAGLRERGANCVFVGRRAQGDLQDIIRTAGYRVHQLSSLPAFSWEEDSRQTLDVIEQYAPVEWVIADHYHIDARWEEALRPHLSRLLVIDDLADRAHSADALLDQNLQDRSDRYAARVAPNCRMFLGPRYALLRPEFVDGARAAARGAAAKRERILACMGGTDPHDVLSKVLAAWQQLPTPRPALDIAVGRASPNVDRLARTTHGCSDVELHVQTARMPELLAQALLVICTTGTISWERCCVGTPAIMGTTAENQELNAQLLARHRTGISVGEWEPVSVSALTRLIATVLGHPTLMRRMGARAHELVDGRGVDRIASYLTAQMVTLRRATQADGELAWPWRNSASTRRFFTNPDPVPYERHVEWWTDVLRDPQRDLLIASIGAVPVGVLRFDQDVSGAVVSIYIDPDLTGLGLGTRILRAGQLWLRSHRPTVRGLIADILPDNAASMASFAAAGFVKQGGRWEWGAGS